jgi:hypothetical protein
MYTVKKISSLFNKPDLEQTLGNGDTQAEAIEVLRDYFLVSNQRLLSMSDVPECIRSQSKINVARNSEIKFDIREDGVVFIDGDGPEMDYYTITEED